MTRKVRVEVVDPLYTILQNNSGLCERRELLNVLSAQYEPYADRNFKVELRRHFVSRFWEMYLGCALVNGGFELVPRKGLPLAGPDLCILQGGSRVWIEAVAPSSGSGRDAVPLPKNQHGLVSEEMIVLRFCSAIKDKFERYRGYLREGLLRPDDPFIIALTGSRIPGAERSFPGDIPYTIQAVLPVGLPTVTIDLKTRQKVGEAFEYRRRIVKKSNADVLTDTFLNPTYQSISGLFFSDIDPLNTVEVSLKSVSFLHNPMGSNRLPAGWMGAGREWWLDDHKLHCRLLNSASSQAAAPDGRVGGREVTGGKRN